LKATDWIEDWALGERVSVGAIAPAVDWTWYSQPGPMPVSPSSV
jgi:hypothetical protein